MRTPLLACLLATGLTFPPLPLGAQSSPRNFVAEFQALETKLAAQWKAKHFQQALETLQACMDNEAFGTLPPLVRAEIHYNAACACARLRRRDEALVFLGLAAGEGYRSHARMKEDPDLASCRKAPGFQHILDAVRRNGDFRAILRRLAPYGKAPADSRVTFTYQSPDHADLARFRQAWHLEEIAGQGDDTSRVLNLLHWVHTQVRHDGASVNPSPRNAMNLLEVCKKEGRGINCRMMATILGEALLALGYPARHVTCQPLDTQDPDCHVITAAWLEEAGKWVYLDPTFEAFFKDPDGRLLSVPEVRSALAKGEDPRLCAAANWNGQRKDPKEYLEYMTKNMVSLQCPQESASGYESRPGGTIHIQLQPAGLSLAAAEGMVMTHDEAAFWARPLRAVGPR